uniref:Uncharacterized protein n=1 Tax=Arundo donax TaxID=35708 RepID=A0A0A9EV03_ARUDO
MILVLPCWSSWSDGREGDLGGPHFVSCLSILKVVPNFPINSSTSVFKVTGTCSSNL